jgi:hypothetical protein
MKYKRIEVVCEERILKQARLLAALVQKNQFISHNHY